MAAGIVDCNGRIIKTGDKVRTPSGAVIKVTGAAVGISFHNAEQCEKVNDNTPCEKARQGGENLDCIVWGE